MGKRCLGAGLFPCCGRSGRNHLDSQMKPNQNYTIAQVVNFLNGQGYLAWRQENNGRIDEKSLIEQLLKLFDALTKVNYTSEKKAELFRSAINKCYRPVPCALKGVPDVIGFNLKTGHWISVEVKLGDDQLRPDQIDFSAKVRQTESGEFWLCREIESFKQGWYRKHQPQKAAA